MTLGSAVTPPLFIVFNRGAGHSDAAAVRAVIDGASGAAWLVVCIGSVELSRRFRTRV